MATGFASGYPHILATRVIGGVGASPQHPTGSAILAAHFGQARGPAFSVISISYLLAMALLSFLRRPDGRKRV